MASTLSLPALQAYLTQRHGCPVQVLDVQGLSDKAVTAVVDHSVSSHSLKVFGYGRPLLIRYRVDGEERRVVLHTAPANQFGHENRADRAAGLLLAYDIYNTLPQHVPALDVGIFVQDEASTGAQPPHAQPIRLLSLGAGGEFFLLSQFVTGEPYAQDLQRLRDDGTLTALDLARAERLARYLTEIHAVKYPGAPITHTQNNSQNNNPQNNDTQNNDTPNHYLRDRAALYRRRIRDTVGSGEGIMGLIDSYPPDFNLVGPGWLADVEQACVAWRWRLKDQPERLCQVHGDYHPFNIMFNGETTFYLLDRSRGAWGEAADDVSCLAINYLFFSLQRSGTLAEPFRSLWDRFWRTYLDQTGDTALLTAAIPFLVWRALVLASPVWYNTPEPARRTLLRLIDTILRQDAFDPERIDQYLGMSRPA